MNFGCITGNWAMIFFDRTGKTMLTRILYLCILPDVDETKARETQKKTKKERKNVWVM